MGFLAGPLGGGTTRPDVPVPCLVQAYLLMATVIFLPYVSKVAGWCRARLVGRCQAGLECGVLGLPPGRAGHGLGRRRPCGAS